jgi:hypothetical protein
VKDLYAPAMPFAAGSASVERQQRLTHGPIWCAVPCKQVRSALPLLPARSRWEPAISSAESRGEAVEPRVLFRAYVG